MNTAAVPYPVTVRGDLSVPPGRWLWLVKWLLAIPHWIVLTFLVLGGVIAWVLALFAILFTGKYPRSLFDYITGVLRWCWRVAFYGYTVLGTDRYPPFSLDPDPDYPADLDVIYPERLSRGLVLVKWWLLAIPHYIIVGFFMGSGDGGGLTFVMAIIAAIVLLFTGKYPKDIFDLVVGMNRWGFRTYAYAVLTTDAYPPFRLFED
jgi:hypothetical protein